MILMNGRWRRTYRALAPAMLCAAVHAQTPPTIPAATAPAAAYVRPVHVATLPDVTTALSSSTRSASQSLHVLVGRSIFIKSTSRLKRVYVSNPLAVNSFTSSPTQIVVTAKQPGVSSLILWDEAGQSATYVVFVRPGCGQPAKRDSRGAAQRQHQGRVAAGSRFSLRHGVERCFGRGGRQAGCFICEGVVNSVMVRQPHIRQVKLQVEIIEIDRSKLEQFGINLFSQGQ